MDILRSVRAVAEAEGPGVVDWDRAAAAAKSATDPGSVALSDAERAGYAADVRDARSRLAEVAGIEFDVPDTVEVQNRHHWIDASVGTFRRVMDPIEAAAADLDEPDGTFDATPARRGPAVAQDLSRVANTGSMAFALGFLSRNVLGQYDPLLLADEPACVVYAHRDDLAWAREPGWHVLDAYGALGADYPCPPDVAAWVAGLLGAPTPVSPLDAGDRLELDDGRAFRVIHLPGHSPGHIGLWEPEERLLLMSDALLSDGQRVADRVVAIPSYLDVDAYLGSIRTVRALAPDVACPAHFGVLDGEATHAFCDDSEAFVHRLDAAVRSTLSDDRPRTLREITATVVPEVAPTADVTMVAALSVQAHLDALERHGMATWRMDGPERAWSRT